MDNRALTSGLPGVGQGQGGVKLTVPISVKEDAADHGIPATEMGEAHFDIATEVEAHIAAIDEAALYA